MHEEKVSLTVGVDLNGNYVSVHNPQVPSGAKCRLSCPECGEGLIARKGEELRHHLAHGKNSTCAASNESALHKFAKEVFSKKRSLAIGKAKLLRSDYSEILGQEYFYNYEHEVFPEGRIFFDEARIEYQMHDPNGNLIVADVAYLVDEQPVLLLEVKCTHAVDSEKSEKVQLIGVPMVEVSMPAISIGDMIDSGQDWQPVVEKLVLEGDRKWIVHMPQYLAAIAALNDDYWRCRRADEQEHLKQQDLREQKVLAERKQNEELQLIKRERHLSNEKLIEKAKGALGGILHGGELALPAALVETSKNVKSLQIGLVPKLGKQTNSLLTFWLEPQDRWVVRLFRAEMDTVAACQGIMAGNQFHEEYGFFRADCSHEDMKRFLMRIPQDFQIVDVEVGEGRDIVISGKFDIEKERTALRQAIPDWMHGDELVMFNQLIDRTLMAKSLFPNKCVTISMALPVNGIVNHETGEPLTAIVAGVIYLSWTNSWQQRTHSETHFITTTYHPKMDDEFVEPINNIGGFYLPAAADMHNFILDQTINRYGAEHEAIQAQKKVAPPARPKFSLR